MHSEKGGISMISKTLIYDTALDYDLDVEVVEKIADKYSNDPFDFSKACARLKSYLESVIELFEKNEDSPVLYNVYDCADYVNRLNENANKTFEIFKYESIVRLSKSTLLSQLLSNDIKNKKKIDFDFIVIMKYLFSEISINDMEKYISTFDEDQLRFIRDYSILNNRKDLCLRFDKDTFNQYLNLVSKYKLDNQQTNNLYETLMDYDEDKISLEDIFDIKQIIIDSLKEDKEHSVIDLKKRELIDTFGEEFYKRYMKAFTNYVLSKNLDKVINIINSEEFIDYPELASATVLAKSNIDRIREVLSIPYLKEEKYQELISPSLFTQNPDKICTNIELCNELGLEDFSNNRTLIIQNNSEELLSKINFLNSINEPLYMEERLHPLFRCNSNSKIKEITRDMTGVELSRNELIDNYGYFYTKKKNEMYNTKVLRK